MLQKKEKKICLFIPPIRLIRIFVPDIISAYDFLLWYNNCCTYNFLYFSTMSQSTLNHNLKILLVVFITKMYVSKKLISFSTIILNIHYLYALIIVFAFTYFQFIILHFFPKLIPLTIFAIVPTKTKTKTKTKTIFFNKNYHIIPLDRNLIVTN